LAGLTNEGTAVITILHQYGIVGRGHSIHLPAHWEWFKKEKFDMSFRVGGKQRIKSIDVYLVPLSISNGFP
jgi:hypothetical protein